MGDTFGFLEKTPRKWGVKEAKIEEIAIEIGIPLTAHRPAVVAMAVSELHKKLLGEPRKKK